MKTTPVYDGQPGSPASTRHRGGSRLAALSPGPTQKTYWHLMSLGRMPSEYEIVTSRLLYYLDSGFEVRVPLQEWYDRYQKGSPLLCSDWEAFHDPRETIYSSYTRRRSRSEILVDHVLESAEKTDHDRLLSPAWIGMLERVLAPLRYLCHGLQMAASYLAHMAPGGRIVVAGLFQVADEIRRLQRIAYRMRQLQLVHPGFGDGSRGAWQDDPLWQPARELIERLLVTYDWGECFVALDLVVKPRLDELFMARLARLARDHRDAVLADLLSILGEDCGWHREWSGALVGTLLDAAPANGAVIERWSEKWRPMATRATDPFELLFEAVPCS